MFRLPYDRILVPVDLSEASLRAVEATRETLSDNDELHIINVLEAAASLSFVQRRALPSDDVRIDEALEVLHNELDSRRHAKTFLEVRIGDPVEMILAFAKEIDADVIVIPTRGRSGLDRLMMGSVAEKVVRHAHCPVLVLRGEV